MLNKISALFAAALEFLTAARKALARVLDMMAAIEQSLMANQAK